jgi:hypothetical protein
MAKEQNRNVHPKNVLTEEQDIILDMYLQKLDEQFEHIKASEKMEVEIETLHLKRILSR